MCGEVNSTHPIKEACKKSCGCHLCIYDMARLPMECVLNVRDQTTGDFLQNLEDSLRNNLKCQMRNYTHHFLVHNKITLLNPWGDARVRKEFLYRHSEGTMKRGEKMKKSLLLDKADSINQ